jgi:hypothetical protein
MEQVSLSRRSVSSCNGPHYRRITGAAVGAPAWSEVAGKESGLEAAALCQASLVKAGGEDSGQLGGAVGVREVSALMSSSGAVIDLLLKVRLIILAAFLAWLLQLAIQ